MFFRFLGRITSQLERPKAVCQNLFQNRTYSTVFSRVAHRHVDYEALEHLKTTLLYVLRPTAGKEHGFANRDDGYISVKLLLNHPEFKSLDIKQLQDIVTADRKHRFDLDFDPTKGEDSFWIRAKQWNEIHWVMKPVLPDDHPGTPVYATTLEQWKSHIARNGIPRGESDWIEVSRGIPTQEYLEDLEDDCQVFIFLNLRKCMDAGLRFLSPTPSAQKWSHQTQLVTRGNETGYIPPSLFSKVDLVTTQKRLIWGDPKPINHRGWVGFDEVDLTPDGKRKTFLQSVKGVTGFVNYKISNLEGSLDSYDTPKLRAEAAAVIRDQLTRQQDIR